MISIIIITKNDRSVYQTVATILKQHITRQHEIIVVSGSDRLESFPENKNIHVIPYHANKKKITIPEQRNIGVKAAKGEIIVFIDASCIPQRDWLNNLLKPIYSDKENIVAGKTISDKQNTFRNHDRISNTKKYLSEAPTINLAIKKEVFNKIGYFDETFEYGSDVDFTWRAIVAGYKIKFASTAIVTHNWGNYQTEFKRAYRYGKARFRLYKKFKTRRGEILRSDIVVLAYFVLIPVFIVSFYSPMLFLIFLPLFIKNIKNNPFQTITYNLSFGLGLWIALLEGEKSK